MAVRITQDLNGARDISAKDFIYALNAATGDEIWSCEVTSVALPAVVGGTVYASSADGQSGDKRPH